MTRFRASSPFSCCMRCAAAPASRPRLRWSGCAVTARLAPRRVLTRHARTRRALRHQQEAAAHGLLPRRYAPTAPLGPHGELPTVAQSYAEARRAARGCRFRTHMLTHPHCHCSSRRATRTSRRSTCARCWSSSCAWTPRGGRSAARPPRCLARATPALCPRAASPRCRAGRAGRTRARPCRSCRCDALAPPVATSVRFRFTRLTRRA